MHQMTLGDCFLNNQL